MRSRILILLTLACVVAAAVATGASARTERRSDIPTCEELLTVAQAKSAMGERVAFIFHREVRDNTRVCVYAGGSKGPIGHSIGVNWGPYSDVRKRSISSATTSICSASKEACRNIKKAVSLRSNLQSFAYLEKALGDVGTVKILRSSAFDDNPAFAWVPSSALAASLAAAEWVLVYRVKSAEMLQVLCTDAISKTPDGPCAITAAKQAYINVG